MKIRRPAHCAIALLLTAGGVCAQPADPLRASVERALNTSPDVSARFNAYRASLAGVDVARAGYLPRLDLNAGVGRDDTRYSNRSPESLPLNRHEAGLSLTQVLWDGLGTRADVERSGHDRLTRYFELLDVTEQTALEAARAHFDVQRYRRETAAKNDYAPFRKFFKREMHSTMVQNLARLGLLTDRVRPRLAAIGVTLPA